MVYFDIGNVIVEMVYSCVQWVIEYKELFKVEGYVGCLVGQDKVWGCVMCDYLGVVFSFVLQWFGVFFGWNIFVLMSFDYGVLGNVVIGGGSEGKYSYKVGIKGMLDECYDVILVYIGYGSLCKYVDIFGVGKIVVGGVGDIGLFDCNWVLLILSIVF